LEDTEIARQRISCDVRHWAHICQWGPKESPFQEYHWRHECTFLVIWPRASLLTV